VQVTAPRERRGGGRGVPRTAAILVSAFALAAFSVGWHNPTIRFLGYVALLAMPFLLRAVVVLGRRTAGDGGERPTHPEAAKRPNRGPRTVGIGVVLLGLILFAVGLLNHRWAVVGCGLLVVMAGVLLVRISFDHVAGAPGGGSAGEVVSEGIGKFDHLMRATGIALVPVAVLSLASLYLDAAHGYHEAWPLYTIFVVALASALVWPYLLARAYGRWLRR
jgi:hypothetical protein